MNFSENRRPVALESVTVGIGLANRATFPLSFIVDDWSLVWNGQTVADRKPKVRYDIDEMTGVSYADVPLPLVERFGDKVEGTLKFRIRYGKPRAEQYFMERELQFSLRPDPSGLGFNVERIDLVRRDDSGSVTLLGLRPSGLVSGWPKPAQPIARTSAQIGATKPATHSPQSPSDIAS